jgi:hypothetical protein
MHTEVYQWCTTVQSKQQVSSDQFPEYVSFFNLSAHKCGKGYNYLEIPCIWICEEGPVESILSRPYFESRGVCSGTFPSEVVMAHPVAIRQVVTMNCTVGT